MSPAKTCEPIEMPFRWVTRVGLKNHVLDVVQVPKERDNFCGVVRPLKSIVSHCYGLPSKKSIKASARLLQPTALLLTGRCHIDFPPMKNPPPFDAASCQNYLTTCYYCERCRVLRSACLCVDLTNHVSKDDDIFSTRYRRPWLGSQCNILRSM